MKSCHVQPSIAIRLLKFTVLAYGEIFNKARVDLSRQNLSAKDIALICRSPKGKYT